MGGKILEELRQPSVRFGKALSLGRGGSSFIDQDLGCLSLKKIIGHLLF
jgi:hypothetical protein